MSQPATSIREILARVECGLGGAREARQLAVVIDALTYELGYSDEESWQQCRHCHYPRDEGHAPNCPAKGIE